ncbi:MAG: peptidase S41 [Muribaculaceae bacterium]|nr:peptidase S41 [Muribaculaceae bacterium]
MKQKLLAMAFTLATATAATQASPLWLRNVAISPDGKEIAFTYKGHIFTVDTKGGDARQLTSGDNYNTSPRWSPDGKTIAFAGNREGSYDIFVIDRNGGTPQRVTTHSGSETPLAFLDNETILFSANIQPDQSAAQGAFASQVYKVNINGGRPAMFSTIPMMSIDVAPDGRILYQDRKGVENIYRKHERSSATADVWMIDNGVYTKLTDFNGTDSNPLWYKGDEFYFLSDEDGTLNVYSRTVGDKKNKKQHTKFRKHPVRSLSMADDGTMAYSWDGEIYVTPYGKMPYKLKVNIVADEYVKEPSKGISKSGATTLAVSDDGESIAFVYNGDVYVTSAEYATTRRITDTPEQERTVSFAPDGRSIVYDSERDGIWQLFTAEIKDPEEKSMVYATEIVEKPLYKSTKPAFQPAFSPDGKKVAFLEDRTALRVIDMKSKKVNTALDKKYNFSYSDGDVNFEWSPDSKWLLTTYIANGGWNNKDVAIIKADGSEVVNLTESGYSDVEPQWALDGKAVTWLTGKYGYRSHGSWGNEYDAMIMFLDGEAYDRFYMNEEDLKLADKAEKKKKEDEAKAKAEADKKNKKDDKKKDDKKDGDKKENADSKKDDVKELKLDFDNRRYRTARLTGSSSRMGGYYVSPKGDKLYYIASTPEGQSLFQRDLKKGDTFTLVKGISAGGFVPDKKGQNLYLLTRGGIKKLNLANGKTTPIEFEAEYTYFPADQRKYIYDHMWRQVLDKFYDANIHGVDWAMYKKEYEKFLPYINNNTDFSILLSEILGELNASHTGSSYRPGLQRRATATLGAFFDESYKGD